MGQRPLMALLIPQPPTAAADTSQIVGAPLNGVRMRKARNRRRKTSFFSPDLSERGMPSYTFHLHDGPTVPPRTEHVEAQDDIEARSLADLRLTLSSAFTHIEVDRDGKELFRLHRDSGEPR
jgi:hypothetical protein